MVALRSGCDDTASYSGLADISVTVINLAELAQIALLKGAVGATSLYLMRMY